MGTNRNGVKAHRGKFKVVFNTKSNYRVDHPAEHDVICGRGSGVSNHPGNIRFRVYVSDAREEYHNSYRAEKREVAERVCKRVLRAGGRFVAKMENEEAFSEVTLGVSIEKTCQALREKNWKPTNVYKRMQELEARENDGNGSPKVHPRDIVTAYDYEASQNVTPEKKQKLQDKTKTKDSKPDEKRVKKTSKRVYKKSSARRLGGSPGSATQDFQDDQASELSGSSQANKVSLSVGTTISVYWPLDEAFYQATVLERGKKSMHFVKYDVDKETEWLDLSKQEFTVDAAPAGWFPDNDDDDDDNWLHQPFVRTYISLSS